MWLVWCKCGSNSWDLGINSNHICQWDHPGSNHSMKKILECFSPFDDWQSLGDCGDIRIIFILPVLESLPLNFKVTLDMIPLDVCCSKVSSHSMVVSHQVTCHSQPLLRLGSICECWHWDCCSSCCIWIRVSNSTSRLPQVVCKLLELLLFKICKVCNRLNSFSLDLHHSFMWDTQLVRVLKENCGLYCSQYDDNNFSSR